MPAGTAPAPPPGGPPDGVLGLAKMLSRKESTAPLGANVDLFEVGPAAQRLDGDDLHEIANLLAHRVEAVDKFGGEGIDLAVVFDFR